MALRAAGYEVGGVEVKKDGFKILIASESERRPQEDLDRELAEFDEAHRGQD
jgi:hypothetical protein